MDEIHLSVGKATYSAHSAQADYFHARYTVAGITKFWMYKAGEGTHPTLDDLYDIPAIAGTYFPFAYFRYNKVSEVVDKTTQAYLTTRKLVKYLGMDYAVIAEGIEANPDIADVEQAMLIMAVPASTTNALERRYLFEYFDAMYTSQDNPYRTLTQAQIDARLRSNPDLAKTTIVIRDTRFKMALSNGGIFKKRVVGNIGEVGSHASGVTTIPVTTEIITESVNDGGFTYTPGTRITNVTMHYYRQQLTKTLYDEIQVYNLEMVYHIFGEYTTTGDETDKILLIPLDRSITTEYSLPDREVLYSRALHFVFNSRVVTEVKWYQQEWFSLVLTIAAIVLTVVTYGAAWETIAASIAAGTMTIHALVVIIATGLLEYLAVTAAVQLFVKIVGVEAAFVVAIIAAAAGYYMGTKAGGLTGTPWAKDLLKLSTSISAGVQTKLQDMFSDLLGEAADFNEYVKEQTKLLEDANKLLETNNFLSPFVIFGESPTDYYNRTVHSGNIGIVAIDAVSSFVDARLTLPKLNDSLGIEEMNYV